MMLEEISGGRKWESNGFVARWQSGFSKTGSRLAVKESFFSEPKPSEPIFKCSLDSRLISSWFYLSSVLGTLPCPTELVRCLCLPLSHRDSFLPDSPHQRLPSPILLSTTAKELKKQNKTCCIESHFFLLNKMYLAELFERKLQTTGHFSPKLLSMHLLWIRACSYIPIKPPSHQRKSTMMPVI